MKKLYLEYFYIPKEGKIREKAFLARIAASFVFVVVCLFAMGITAYAYFSSSITTKTSSVVAAKYALLYSVNGAATEEAGFVLSEKPSEAVEYQITATRALDSTATTGYCVVTVDIDRDGFPEYEYHTVQLGKDQKADGGERESVTFTLALKDAATVTLEARWGTSIYYNATDAERLGKYISDGSAMTPGASSVSTDEPTDETPDTPEAPVTPETPDTPENPEVPGEPSNDAPVEDPAVDTPEEPDVDTPVTPDDSVVDTPDAPSDEDSATDGTVTPDEPSSDENGTPTDEILSDTESKTE